MDDFNSSESSTNKNDDHMNLKKKQGKKTKSSICLDRKVCTCAVLIKVDQIECSLFTMTFRMTSCFYVLVKVEGFSESTYLVF